jgi:hypothetical protein
MIALNVAREPWQTVSFAAITVMAGMTTGLTVTDTGFDWAVDGLAQAFDEVRIHDITSVLSRVLSE